MVAKPQALDMENVPDKVSGRYLAIGIPLHANILEAAGQLIADRVGAGSATVASIPLDPYVEADMRQEALLVLKLLGAESYSQLLADLADQAEMEGTPLLSIVQLERRRLAGGQEAP